jgi:chromosome segregation ATPase
MRTLLYNFPAAMLILSVAVFTACQSSSEKVDNAKENVEEAKEELEDVRQEVNADAVKVANAAEWQAFKNESEEMIRKNEIRITELKVKMKKPGTTFDAAYAKNIEVLEQKNKNLKTRIGDYENNQSDWEAFKREFNHDMEELGKALQDLTVNNKN